MRGDCGRENWGSASCSVPLGEASVKMCEKQEGVQLVCLSARAEDGMCANIYIKKSMAKPSIHEHERGGPNIGGEDRRQNTR